MSDEKEEVAAVLAVNLAVYALLGVIFGLALAGSRIGDDWITGLVILLSSLLVSLFLLGLSYGCAVQAGMIEYPRLGE